MLQKVSVGAPTQRQPYTDQSPTDHRPNGTERPSPKPNLDRIRHKKSPLAAGLFSMEVRCQEPTRIVTTKAGSSM